MESGTASPPETEVRPVAASGSRRRPSPWLVVVALAAVIGAIVGGIVEHARDQSQAAGDLYRVQVLSTLNQFLDAEHQLLAKPAAQRDASVLADLADSITADTGLNGAGTLTVDAGSGSAGQPRQAVFTVTVGSPHGTTSFAVWYLEPEGPSSSAEGACVLSSTLLGSGRATSDLNLGGSSFVSACLSSYWSASSDPAQPRFDLAGIHRSNPV
jgi:hypothetical protein